MHRSDTLTAVPHDSEAASGPDVCIHLLGNVRILVNASDVTARIKYRKGMALLGLLAVEHDVMHQRDRIADLFWPTLSLASARSNLRQVLSNLAKVLGNVGPDNASVLRINSNSVGLFVVPGLELDVARLDADSKARHSAMDLAASHAAEQLVQPAYTLPSHEFLSGFDLPDCLEHSAWVDQQRRRFADSVIAICEYLGQRAASLGNLELAIDHARTIESIDPLLEINQIRLMELLVASGRPKRALQQFERFAEILRDELDVDPEPATRALYDRIMEHDYAREVQATVQNSLQHSLLPTTVLYATCVATGGNSQERARTLQKLRATVAGVLEHHHGRVIESPGLGVFAYFSWPDGPDSASQAALVAARGIINAISASHQIRVGVFTDVMVDSDQAYPIALGESAELATRLSLIAEHGEIAACATTLRRQPVEAEFLGEWTFRGILKPVSVYRLVQPVHSLPNSVPLAAKR